MSSPLNAARCGILSKASAVSSCPPSNRLPKSLSVTESQLGVSNCCSTSRIGLRWDSFRAVRLFQRGIRQTVTIKQYRVSTVCAATPDLAPGAKTKVAPLTIQDAKIVAEPPQDQKLKTHFENKDRSKTDIRKWTGTMNAGVTVIRVDIDAQATKKAFDMVLKDLAKHAPPVPGFRKAKGGKTSIVPLNVIYQLMGPSLVRKFVIEEIIKATLQDYVDKEGIKVKNELKTDQSSEELSALFEPGKEFGFDATLDLADEQTQDSDAAVAVDEKETLTQPLEATV